MGGGSGSSNTTTVQEADPWEGVQPFLTGAGGQAIYETQQVVNPNYSAGRKGGSGPQYINQNVEIGRTGGTPGIFPEAAAAYGQGLDYYGGQTVTPFSQDTLNSFDQRRNLANAGNPALDAANNSVANIANMSYSDIPQFGGHQNFMSAYGNDIANSVGNRFRMSGRNGGSPKMAQAMGNALGDASQRVYQQEQDRNADLYKNLQENQLRGAALAPGLEAARYNGADQLSSIGAQQENLQNEYQQDAKARHDFEQNKQWELLSRYSGILNSQQLPSSTQTTGPSQRGNTAAGVLGGAATGYSVGGLPGAAIGGVAGLFL